jgi:alcohol dehydrogenase class IV
LSALGVTEQMFDRIIVGAMADHCHPTNPRQANAEDYRSLLQQSM